MSEWFGSPASWYGVGFLGQIMFCSRFVVQWAASERMRRVIVPAAFWYLSLLGGAAMLAYAVHRRDPVFTLGQGAGLILYARNLVLHRRRAAGGAGPPGDPAAGEPAERSGSPPDGGAAVDTGRRLR